MLTIGKQLAQARQDREATIEDIAFETRIPARKLRDMESDDLSNFANLTYAKGFLKLYSRHLGLDFSDYLDQFDTSALASVNGHEYAVSLSVQKRSMPAGSSYYPAPQGARLPVIPILSAAAFLIVGSVVFFKFRQHRQLDTADQVAAAAAPARKSITSPPTVAATTTARPPAAATATLSNASPRTPAAAPAPAPAPRVKPLDDDGPATAPAALRPRIVEETEAPEPAPAGDPPEA